MQVSWLDGNKHVIFILMVRRLSQVSSSLLIVEACSSHLRHTCGKDVVNFP